MRVMFDTNVLISALLFPSPVFDAIFRFSSEGDNTLVLCTYVIDEAREVISRKWPNRSSALETFFLQLDYETFVTPPDPDRSQFEIRDQKDLPVLCSAVLGGVDILVTGDKDFSAVEVDGLSIMTPAKFFNVGNEGVDAFF